MAVSDDIGKIEKAVKEHYGINHLDLKSKSKKDDIPFYRGVIVYIARHVLSKKPAYSKFRDYFEMKNHATFIYWFTQIQNLVDTDRQVRTDIEILLFKLGIIFNTQTSFSYLKSYFVSILYQSENIEEFKLQLDVITNIIDSAEYGK